ncbi:MAG: hypothetical protein LBF83_07985 [Spirochaetaceae bacterium]|jgi:hypothetical protein|nr:hypothetical protein [Spirochaetaceae bacterium]
MERSGKVDISQRRRLYNQFVKSIVEANPEVAAAGSCWEPDALITEVDKFKVEYPPTPPIRRQQVNEWGWQAASRLATGFPPFMENHQMPGKIHGK